MSTQLSRRKFLVAASAGGVAAAAVVATKTAGETAPEDKQASNQGKGYQLTAHVRRYYETTKI